AEGGDEDRLVEELGRILVAAHPDLSARDLEAAAVPVECWGLDRDVEVVPAERLDLDAELGQGIAAGLGVAGGANADLGPAAGRRVDRDERHQRVSLGRPVFL